MSQQLLAIYLFVHKGKGEAANYTNIFVGRKFNIIYIFDQNLSYYKC